MTRNPSILTQCACVLLVAGSLGACTTLGVSSAPSSSGSVSVTDRISNLFGAGQAPASTQTAAAPEIEDYECPSLDVRSGASTITVFGPGEQIGTNVRYQATIGQMARECEMRGQSLTIKVGVQGRVILGPVGGTGQLDVPVRVALVQEGPNPKTIWTKLQRVPVQIPGGQSNVPFVYVENELTVPRPKADDLESYIIYVGFDQNAPAERQRGRAQPRGR